MNQVKIGKFIADKRKEKKLTQQQLAEKLGVSDRAISNWENGKNMPDISLLPIISKELDVTVNDLMSGEKVDKNEYQEKFEENIIYTIDNTVKKENRILKIVLWVIFAFIFSSIMYVSIESIYMHSNMDSNSKDLMLLIQDGHHMFRSLDMISWQNQWKLILVSVDLLDLAQSMLT